MTVNHLMSKKVTALTPALPATHWQTVATFDWRDPAKVYAQVDTSLSSAQVLALAKTLKVAKKVSVMGYTNASTNLAAGVCAGGWAPIRAGSTCKSGTCPDSSTHSRSPPATSRSSGTRNNRRPP